MWSLYAWATQPQWDQPAPDWTRPSDWLWRRDSFTPQGAAVGLARGPNPPGPTWLPKGLADQGTGRLICPDLSLTAAYTRFSPRPWDVRWGRWVTCRGCLGRHRRAGLVCPFRAAVTSVETTTPAMLPSGRPGVVGVVVWWAILRYPKEGAAGRRWVLRRPPRQEAVTFGHGVTPSQHQRRLRSQRCQAPTPEVPVALRPSHNPTTRA